MFRVALAGCALVLGVALVDEPALVLVETAPVETELDHPDLPEFREVWLELIEGAQERLELAHFYASNSAGSALEPVIAAVEAAAERGVAVRFLAEERFYRTYPETLERLAARDGIELLRYDMRALSGGVMHAKYMLVDGRAACLGSANFDWRSLEHIQELGLVVRVPEVVAALGDAFELDWHLAGGGEREDAPAPTVSAEAFPVEVEVKGGETLRLTPALSPTGLLPDEGLWDLPRLVEWIDGAEREVRVQLLTYKAIDREGRYWETLESALRRAAARGARVRLLVADWGKRPGTIEGLKSLEVLDGIEVKLVTLPPAEQGHIPFARVIHAKYMVVDDARAWIGTGNWERGYFHTGRNVGLLLEGRSTAARLSAFFEDGWASPYAYAVDPAVDYEVPRIGD